MSAPRPEPDLAKWLVLAASPTFAAMALMTVLAGREPMATMCSGGHAPFFGGMIPMYLLMSAFHLPPWLRLAMDRAHRLRGAVLPGDPQARGRAVPVNKRPERPAGFSV